MSTTPTSPHDGQSLPARRLKLIMNTPPSHAQDTFSEAVVKDGSSSPVRPSYSPVTPTFSHAQLTREDVSQRQWMDEPEPLPVSLDENSDAIALRATISLLQMQRQQGLRDIRNLDRIKHEALKDPEAFTNDLRQGKLSKNAPEAVQFDDGDDDHDEDRGNDDERETSGSIGETGKFGKLPTAQNIARCPPIEWSKYHIIGEPLDRLHHLQQKYPGLTEEALSKGISLQPHTIAAPYRPFVDRIEPKSNAGGDRRFDK